MRYAQGFLWDGFSYSILNKIESTVVLRSIHDLNTLRFHIHGGNDTSLVLIVEISPTPVRMCWYLICVGVKKGGKKVAV